MTIRQIRAMTSRERAMVVRRLRITRPSRLAALRDVLGAAILLGFAGVYGFRAWPSPSAVASWSEEQSVPPAVLFAASLPVVLGLTAVLMLRQAWVRMSASRSEVGRLRRDLKVGIVEESEHRTVRALLLEAPDGWVAALLEDESGTTRFVEAVPSGYEDADLLLAFPPAMLRLEKALHSGLDLMETREGRFDVDPDAVVVGDRPPDLPEHGTVFPFTLDQIASGSVEARHA
ncbi:hypothetical protein [Methylobacterium radiotolerans]|uniref:hypothetical protein n=1 Tax=Methylobacterium radiotolerans TaxID=31998 RepID=UPI0038D02A6D